MVDSSGTGDEGGSDEEPDSSNIPPQEPEPSVPGNGNVRPGDDAWLAFSYLVAGVGLYGSLGWALGRWLHLQYLAPAGILVGAVFGLWLVIARFVRLSKVEGTPPRSQPDGQRVDQSQTELTSDDISDANAVDGTATETGPAPETDTNTNTDIVIDKDTDQGETE